MQTYVPTLAERYQAIINGHGNHDLFDDLHDKDEKS